MSKIGKKPIIIKAGVDVKIDKQNIIIKGPKWELSYKLLDSVNAKVEDNHIVISITDNEKGNLWGLTRTLVSNIMDGVSDWFVKKLLLIWVGYSAKKEWNWILFALWLSHKVKFDIPSSIQFEVEQDIKGNYVITLSSIDKQYLWEVAAKIRDLKKPEPYKWKWIRYFDEVIKIKAWKTAKK